MKPHPALERGKRLALTLPASLADKVPRDHREADQAFAHRRRIVAAVSLTGAGLLGVSLSTRPGSPQFYATTLGVAGVWVTGGIAAGPLHLGWERGPDRTLRRPVVTPIVTGGYAFAVFYGAALLVRRAPVLDAALRDILRFAAEGSTPLVLITTLANGAAEEVFFRGALYAAVGEKSSVAVSTAVYTLATVATWSAPHSPDYEPTKMGIWKEWEYVEEAQEFYSGV